MGINNLWLLLAPVGRQIEIETLASKVLAVDASIWLTQFIKAMRDDEGKMIKNAHLIGTFHRVAKLLFYRIKPVFVFDGQTPELKKKTIARRRQRHDHQAANLRQTAQRILINHLKLQREKVRVTLKSLWVLKLQ
jgi:DNA excision repair protein ERCC-5